MAASDIPPTPFVLRIAGLKGDPATGGFNVQSFEWPLEVNGDGPNKINVTVTRLVDSASLTISAAFALHKSVGSDATITVIDGAGAEVASYLLTDPKVFRYELLAAVGGNERATETIVLAPSHITITIAKSKRSTVL